MPATPPLALAIVDVAKHRPAPWSMQTLRVIEGASLPEALTFIVLPESRRSNSGQCWQVMKISGRTLHCMVMPDDHDYMNEPSDMQVVHWQWATRRAARAAERQ